MSYQASAVKSKLVRELTVAYRNYGVPKEADRKKAPTQDELLSDKFFLIQLIRRGVPFSLFSAIRDYVPFSDEDWAELLDISAKTLQRYEGASKPFKPLQSEKILEMAEVTNSGAEVFGTIEKFRSWLETPVFALGNMRPIELLKDSYGKEMVMGELTRINHGILA